MFFFNKITAFIISCLVCSNMLLAQTSFFERISTHDLPASAIVSKPVKEMRLFKLNDAGLRAHLSNAPLEFHNNGVTLPLEIPLPDGTTETFGLVESPVLMPDIAAQHPEIKTYCGNGLRHPQTIIRLSVTNSGLNAILLNTTGGDVYFEKYAPQVDDVYFTYYTKDANVPPGGLKSRCGVGMEQDIPKINPENGVSDRNNTGGTLRTYRLAMAANAEFTIAHGGTQSAGFDAIVFYVNRMDAVYRNELSVHFLLVSGTNLVYTNPATDPYDNDDQVAMLTENHDNCNTVIGSGNYDIGHVMGYTGGSGGGIASLQAVCDDGIKGKGVSGEGDLGFYAQVFMDQLVFHEVGHQFGMTHSYNSVIPVCTTRSAPTSVEPGSGATIMSYGFTCNNTDPGFGPVGDDDYFFTSIPFTGPILQFHTVSYEQAEDYISNTNPAYGGSCVVSTPTGNSPPVITMPAAYTIPKSTPFVLTGSATDPNGNGLTYCWEGTNIGTSTPTSGTLADLTKSPFFRTYSVPDSSGATRYFPLLSAILNGSNYAKGDKLPSVGVTTTHRLTVRDNNAAGGGLSYAGLSITVSGSIGPFLETTNLSGSYPALSTQTITWSVNGTNTATPNVKISLSTDGGLTFPFVLLASTPNDGSQLVTLPNSLTTTARIKVESVGNIFFDISNTNFAITAALPVELMAFGVSVLDKNNALLQWKTTDEVGTSGFEIEMQQGNGVFKTMGFEASKGATHELSYYEFVARDLSAGTYYFRLKIVDRDGSFKYSSIQTLQIGKEKMTAVVFPNPSLDGTFSVLIKERTNEKIDIKVVNSLGQLVQNQRFDEQTNKLFLQEPGVYHLIITIDETTSIISKVVVLK